MGHENKRNSVWNVSNLFGKLWLEVLKVVYSTDEIRTGRYKMLHTPSNLISGQEDAANNYARAHHTAGEAIWPKTQEAIRKTVENCERFEGFMLTHSLGGGTGSGYYAKMLEHAADEFSKNPKMEVVIFPCPKVSSMYFA